MPRWQKVSASNSADSEVEYRKPAIEPAGFSFWGETIQNALQSDNQTLAIPSATDARHDVEPPFKADSKLKGFENALIL
jgi:hypothetical protein